MYERFTDVARKAMQLANREAIRLNHEYIGTEHILLGLTQDDNGDATDILKGLGADPQKIRNYVEKLAGRGPEMIIMGRLPMSPRAKAVMERAEDESRKLTHSYIGVEHILLGMLREEDTIAAHALGNAGLTVAKVMDFLGSPEPSEVNLPSWWRRLTLDQKARWLEKMKAADEPAIAWSLRMAGKTDSVTIVLDRDIRDDDVKPILEAIGMIRGVRSVERSWTSTWKKA